MNLEFVEIKSCFIRNFFLQCFVVARISESLGELSQILDHRRTLKEAAKEEFIENSYTFYVRQIILPNIDLLRSSLTRNVQVVLKRTLEKLHKLNKSNPLRFMINASKNKTNFLSHFYSMVWVLSKRVEDISLQ